MLKKNLAISGAIFLDDPIGFSTESFQDLVVVAVLWKLEVALSSEPRINLSSHCPSPLSPLASTYEIALKSAAWFYLIDQVPAFEDGNLKLLGGTNTIAS
ncbi:hypothetical protein NE237_007265 [Protea cynaroides]|uniref:Uncharacterized protein n=1 Tax=Protea cynaroides TaxID=273540 RepID=A0A9Q0KPW5_9MAGN|nr:hypothetical protein NE237_007265 [Protea cynaroides]